MTKAFDPADFIGSRFSKLIVVSQQPSTIKSDTNWLCQCDCGKTAVRTRNSLISKKSMSCGCNKRVNKKLTASDMSNQIFGKLRVLGRAPGALVVKWFCVCECGTFCNRIASGLKSGRTTHCGCGLRTLKFNDFKNKQFGGLRVISKLDGDHWSGALCECVCGKNLQVKLTHLKLNLVTSCGCLKKLSLRKVSREHLNKYRLELGFKEDEYISPIRELARIKAKPFMQETKIRDGFKCVLCGENHNLETHHIKPVSLFPELNLIKSNMITLCKYCHRHQAHKGNVRNLPCPILAMSLQRIANEREGILEHGQVN